MVELSYQHIEIVKSEVYNSGISFSHLQYDLIDHICCDIENEMQKGLPFENAFAKVKRQFSSEGLQKIQEETLLLINKKYRIMKTTMKIFGVIAPFIIAFGTLFKIEHWPGAGILLTLGFFLLAVVFLPSAVYVSYCEVSNKSKLLAHISGFISGFLISISFLFKVQHWPGAGILILAGVAVTALVFLPALFISKMKSIADSKKRWMYLLGMLGSFIYITGFLCKVQHWPGASILLITGSFLTLFLAFPWYVFYKYKEEKGVSVTYIFITVAIAWLIIPTLLISLNLSQDVQKTFRQVNDLGKFHMESLTSGNNRIYDQLNASLTGETAVKMALYDTLKKRSDEVVGYIEKVKKDVELASETFNSSSSIMNVLYGNSGSGEAKLIEEKILNYKIWLMQFSGKNNGKEQLLNTVLSVKSARETFGDMKTIGNYQLRSSNLITVLNKLNWLEEDVREAEGIVLHALIKK